MSGDAAIAYYEGGTELTGVVLEALRAAGREVDPLDPTIWPGSTSSMDWAARRR